MADNVTRLNSEAVKAQLSKCAEIFTGFGGPLTTMIKQCEVVKEKCSTMAWVDPAMEAAATLREQCIECAAMLTEDLGAAVQAFDEDLSNFSAMKL